MLIDAFHLPALPDAPTTVRDFGVPGSAISLRVPRLTPEMLDRQIDLLLAARSDHLAHRPVDEIVAAIGAVADRFLDPADPLRRTAEAALPSVTGNSPEMSALVLDRMAADWRGARLHELLQAELPDPHVLDGFRPRVAAPGRTRAFGPRLTTHFFSGNVPGVSVTALVRSLLVKSAVLGKAAGGEPVLTALFARGLAEVDRGLGECVAVAYWPGGEESVERVALGRADAVVVYGSHETVEGLRGRCGPGRTFLGYGHRISFGVVAREALSRRGSRQLAARAAADVAIFDQRGCVSPHLYYAEEEGETSVAEWAGLLAEEMERIELALPRGALTAEESSAIRQVRGEAEFAGFSGRDVRVHSSTGDTRWTVIHDPDPAFAPSCLNRVVRVKPVASVDRVISLVEPFSPVLQSVGVAGPVERLQKLVEALGALGVTRAVTIGSLAWPPPTWHHDGRPPLLDLLRWCDWED